MDLHSIVDNLSKKKPIIRSENELLQYLYYEVLQEGFKCFKNSTLLGRKVDLLIKDENEDVYYAVHLRDKTEKLSAHLNGNDYELKKHGATLVSRYDFLKDIECLEKIAHPGKVIGYGLLLTNDHSYWTKPQKVNAFDAAFHIYDDRNITGELKWASGTSLGTRKKREDPIRLKSTYNCKWKSYSHVSNEKNGTFEYLLLEVK